MRRSTAFLLILLVVVVAFACLWRTHSISLPANLQPDPEGCIRQARKHCQGLILAHFQKAGVPYPAREIFLRAFKREAVLELWACGAGDQFALIQSYPVKAPSGGPGPKRREGDLQVPEGFYIIESFNPRSLFHLSLRVNYPNASDRVLSDPAHPGSDIYVHGGSASVGCLPLGDDGIEEVYLTALDAGNQGAIPIHIFPARMSGAAWDEFVTPFRANRSELVKFWEQLQPGFDGFEQKHRLPDIAVAADGRYLVNERR